VCKWKQTPVFSGTRMAVQTARKECKGPESRAGPSSFHFLAVPRIRFGESNLRSAGSASLAGLSFGLGLSSTDEPSIRSYPHDEGTSFRGRNRPTDCAPGGPFPLPRTLTPSSQAKRQSPAVNPWLDKSGNTSAKFLLCRTGLLILHFQFIHDLLHVRHARRQVLHRSSPDL
jgi:hypothetical protein